MSPSHTRSCVMVGGCAALLLVWACASYWFSPATFLPADSTSHAIGLLALWAIGPAIWLVIESRTWPQDPQLANCQRHARDLWLGGGVLLLLLVWPTILSPSVLAASSARVDWLLVIEGLRVAVWPLLAALGLLLMQEPLKEFLQALGSRASRIGAFNLVVELGSLPEAQPWSGVRLDDLKAEFPASATDSSNSLFQTIAETTAADYVIVNLEDGKAWLTSRLFILAALLPRVRTIKQMVFLHGPSELYLGHASPSAVAEALGKNYPWLVEAYITAHTHLDPEKQIRLHLGQTLLGRTEPHQAGQLLRNFLHRVQQDHSVSTGVQFSGGTVEHGTWLAPADLQGLLGRALEVESVKRDPALEPATVAKTLLRHESPFVAVLDTSGRFSFLIDRHRALDQVVRRELR